MREIYQKEWQRTLVVAKRDTLLLFYTEPSIMALPVIQYLKTAESRLGQYFQFLKCNAFKNVELFLEYTVNESLPCAFMFRADRGRELLPIWDIGELARWFGRYARAERRKRGERPCFTWAVRS